jgi:putative membrane protein
MQILIIFSLIIAFLAILFAVQNVEPVTITFLVWEIQGSLALVLFLTIVAGALISYLASMPGQIRSKRMIANQQKRIAELEEKTAAIQPPDEEPQDNEQRE